jgi:hypothetical protein
MCPENRKIQGVRLPRGEIVFSYSGEFVFYRIGIHGENALTEEGLILVGNLDLDELV